MQQPSKKKKKGSINSAHAMVLTIAEGVGKVHVGTNITLLGPWPSTCKKIVGITKSSNQVPRERKSEFIGK